MTGSLRSLTDPTIAYASAMRVSAKADYAVRAAVELAAGGEGPIKGEAISQAQEIPLKFLENILGELKHAGLVRSQRGMDGGYWLARAADEITVADVIRAVDGPLASVRGDSPEALKYGGARSRCATSGSRCARTCARCSRTSRSPTSRRTTFRGR